MLFGYIFDLIYMFEFSMFLPITSCYVFIRVLALKFVITHLFNKSPEPLTHLIIIVLRYGYVFYFIYLLFRTYSFYRFVNLFKFLSFHCSYSLVYAMFLLGFRLSCSRKAIIYGANWRGMLFSQSRVQITFMNGWYQTLLNYVFLFCFYSTCYKRV